MFNPRKDFSYIRTDRKRGNGAVFYDGLEFLASNYRYFEGTNTSCSTYITGGVLFWVH
jgi:hypothetical protein